MPRPLCCCGQLDIALPTRLRSGDSAAAVAAAEAAVAADRFDEPAHRLLMSAYRMAREPGRALACYAGLRQVLAEQLGVDPAPETQRLHLGVLRGGAAAAQQPATPAAAAPTRRPDRRRLAGREAELATLAAAWSDAAGGTSAMFVLTGEAGIGKTAQPRRPSRPPKPPGDWSCNPAVTPLSSRCSCSGNLRAEHHSSSARWAAARVAPPVSTSR